MVIDSSALVAILLDEPDGEELLRKIAAVEHRLVAVGSFLETFIVVSHRRGPPGEVALDRLAAALEIEAVPFDLAQLRLAREAWLRFGKGRHPAALNFGDCMAYALARAMGQPLLFKGDDFGRTDIAAA